MPPSSSACPACGAPVDPARAPVARVRASRILTFCSTGCAEREGEGAPKSGESAVGGGPERARARRPLRWAGGVLVGAGVVIVAVAIGDARGGRGDGADGAPAPGRAENPTGEEAAVPVGGFIAARTEAVLREASEGASPSLAPIAAAALARVGDERALALLRDHLERAADPLPRVAWATALARAGDESGHRALEDALAGDDPDVAISAGFALARLGADPPRAPLVRLLDANDHRMSAAVVLARLGDERGVRALRAGKRRRGASEEERWRAAVELALAGEGATGSQAGAGEGPAPVDLLWVRAARGDDTAVAELNAALRSPYRRVDAAEALADLGAEVELEPLVRALVTERGAARIAAAEAVLILEKR